MTMLGIWLLVGFWGEPPPIPGNDTYHALLIGIDQYQTKGVHQLSTPVKDVQALKSLLLSQYGFAKAKTLVNKHASKQTILQKLDLLAESGDPYRNLLVYFAGHGVVKNGSSYWVPTDGDPFSGDHLLNTVEIVEKIERMNFKHVLVIVASCFSGQFLNGATSIDALPNFRELYDQPSRWVMTAGGNQTLSDRGFRNSSKNGLFASALIDYLTETKQPYLTPVRIGRDLSRILQGKGHSQLPIVSPILVEQKDLGSFIFWNRHARDDKGKFFGPPWLVEKGAHIDLELLPLHGRNILIKNPSNQNQQIVAQLEALGMHVKLVTGGRSRTRRSFLKYCDEIDWSTVAALLKRLNLSSYRTNQPLQDGMSNRTDRMNPPESHCGEPFELILLH